MELARRNPDINYIGIEKYSSVLVRAIEKREKEEEMSQPLFYTDGRRIYHKMYLRNTRLQGFI